MKLLLVPLLALSLAGCAQTVAKTIAAGDETFDAVKDYVDEVTDDRENLRKERRDERAAIRNMWRSQAILAEQEGDFEAAEAARGKVLAQIDEIYPDVVDLVNEIDRINEAIEAARAQ